MKYFVARILYQGDVQEVNMKFEEGIEINESNIKNAFSEKVEVHAYKIDPAHGNDEG